MMNEEKLKKLSQNLVADSENYINSFRENMFMYISDKDITIREIAEKADISFNTLNSFLYGNSQDCKLANAVKLAKALNVSIDELVGAETIPELSRESLALCRNLPENDLYLIRWFIRYIHDLNEKTEPNKRYVLVMQPDIDNNGDLLITTKYTQVEITQLQEPVRSKAFFGIQLGCDYYMPYYSPNDVIFVANDRPPKVNENVVVRVGKYLFVVRQKNENGVTKFYSIRDGKYRIDKNNNIEIVGYIANILKNTEN